MKKERENDFGSILDSLQKIRSDIVRESQQELMFTGVMPAAAQRELKLVADITAAVFNGLMGTGVAVGSDPSNPALAVMTIGGKNFSCLKAQLIAELGTEASVSPSVTPAEEVSTPLAEAVDEPAMAPIKEHKDSSGSGYVPMAELSKEEPDIVSNDSFAVGRDTERASLSNSSNSDFAGGRDEEEPEDVSVDINDILTQESAVEETVLTHIPAPKPMPAPAPLAKAPAPREEPEPIVYTPEPEVGIPEVDPQRVQAPSDPQGVVSLSEDDDDSSTVPNEMVEAAPITTGKATIIGGEVSSISSVDKTDFFIEETSKLESEFVYCFSKISVMHTDMGGGGRPEEMLVLVAPLKICKYATTSVPIVVTIVHNGKSVTASSYDILEEGKNIVTIDISEFYFLCRGSFDDKGRFKASIVTTGISSQQNDRITPLFSKTYGNAQDKETRNGHIKFRYTADSGPGTVEVLPFGSQGDRSEDFVAIVKNKEFVDYYLVSKSLKANTRAIIYSEGGVMNELVCHWEDDELIADLI